MKRKYATIEQFDYTSKEEFEAHKTKMIQRGYTLIEGIFSGVLDHGEIVGDDKWKYNASFIKSDML